jgi:IclR family transcriptional regulator, acetate operon repressor
VTAQTRDQPAPTGGVQSVERTLDLLELLADADGSVGLSQLAESSGLPMPTIHRLIRTLANRGYVRQEQNRRYTLGPLLIRLGDTAGRMLGTWARPCLVDVADRTGETANLAVLEGDEVVYLAQAPSRHAMRMFTEPGRRVLPHCTGVGKAILAQLPESRVRSLVERTGLPARTPHTITELPRLLAELAETRTRGYALDDGEQEVGVRCVAVPVPGTPSLTALSMSGPHARITEAAIDLAVPVLRQAADRISAELSRVSRESVVPQP